MPSKQINHSILAILTLLMLSLVPNTSFTNGRFPNRLMAWTMMVGSDKSSSTPRKSWSSSSSSSSTPPSSSRSTSSGMNRPSDRPDSIPKDRHRRRPPGPPGHDDDDDSNEKGSRTGQPQRSNDPWKVLVKKLDSTKSAKEKFGKIDIVKKASDAVIDELQCPHFSTCAGCSMNGNFSDAPILKRARNFFAAENLRFPTHLGNVTQWRTHVKLAVRPLSRWGGLKIGLFKASSHEVEAIPECRVHHPRINEAVEELRRAAMEVGVRGYQEGVGNKPAEGELRYVQMSVERETGKVQIVLVWNAMMFKDAEQTLPRLVKRLKGRPDLWHSVYANFQTSTSNTILNYHPKAWKVLWGPPALREKVGEASFFFSPQIFRQSNLDAFEKGIIPAVIRHIPAGSTVAELYSGIGVLGLNAATTAKVVLCSDTNEYVDEVFDRCADSLPEEHREKVFYENLSAEDAISQGQCEDAEVLIVDPPRKGLDQGVLDLLLDKHETATAPRLKRLIYVSCGFEALERDTQALIDKDQWRIKSTEGFILFPGSDHVETVIVFDKKEKNVHQEI